MTPFIKYLRIKNFKSITDLEIRDIPAFAVFAGPNGAGKSNFFEALKFVSDFVRFGIRAALKMHDGYENIHSVKLKGKNARTFEFEIILEQSLAWNIKGQEHTFSTFRYTLCINALDSEPIINESTWYDEKQHSKRYRSAEKDSFLGIADVEEQFPPFGEDSFSHLRIPTDPSILRYDFSARALSGIRKLHIDPIGAKNANSLQYDNSELEEKAHNLVSVMTRLEKNDTIRETIMDMMSLFAPAFEQASTQQERLRAAHILTIKERGVKKEFPAHLISDGTIYALALLVAVLDRHKDDAWTLIEEPERGLHPKAIAEMINFMRSRVFATEIVTPRNTKDTLQTQMRRPIWLTTHSATVVRHCKAGELWFVEKENGGTVIRRAEVHPESRMELDEAWLSNALDGGLPW
ncbi:MAG: AAA family ATPase [Candidatus Kapabacteria bacterium]|jgi:predicted ATPase|nr:AAA family ATPase [Candidatus Kapabacteria bacterium]